MGKTQLLEGRILDICGRPLQVKAHGSVGFDLRFGNCNAARRTLEGQWEWVCAVAFSLDGKLVASASVDGTVML